MAKQTNLAKRIFAIVISALLLSSMGICAIAADDTNNAWLKDSKWGFEADTETIKAEWEEATVTDTDSFYEDSVFITSEAKGVRSGRQGLKLVADGIDFIKVGVKTEFQNGVSGKTLAMEGFIKTENLTGDAKVIVQFASDADFANVKHTITYTSELTEWTKFQYYPSGDGTPEYMRIAINGSGTVYVDDVGPRTSDSLIKNPSFDLTPKGQNGEEAFDIQGWYAARGAWDETWKWNKLGGGSVEKLENSALQSMPAVWQPVEPIHKMQNGDVYKCSVKFKCADSTLKPSVGVLYTPTENNNIFSDMNYLAFEKASDADADGFVTYEATFTMPDKTHYGFALIGPYGATGAIYDDLIVERFVADVAEFSCRGEACAAFWPGNKIVATSQIDANVGDSVTVLMALYNRENNQLLGFSSEEKTFTEAGLGEASATLMVPKDTMADTLEAYVWRKGDMKPFAKKAILPRGEGEEVVVRTTERDADIFGFETNSISLGDTNKGDWWEEKAAPYGFPTATHGYGTGLGTAAIVDSETTPALVKEGNYALKLECGKDVDNPEAGGNPLKPYITMRKHPLWQQLPENSGKHITVEGYVNIHSLASDSYVLIGMYHRFFGAAYLREYVRFTGSENTDAMKVWEKDTWIPVRLTVPTKSGYADNAFALTLVGEGEVYFDDFHLVEDKNLIMNGDFRPGLFNGYTSPAYLAARTIQNWTAVANNTTSQAWRGAWKYDNALECAYNSSDSESDDKAWLQQDAVYSNRMVPGNTYEISVLYAEYDVKNSSADGGGTPAVVIGGETVTLTKTDKTVTRGTGANAREFTLYTADYTLPKDAAVPTSYQLRTSGLRSTSVVVWYADFAIYAY